jgi:superfamily II DNA or RNA helicase
MVGYFDSIAFRHLAPGLAAFINESNGKMRLLASPVLGVEDQEAIRDAVLKPDVVMASAISLLFEGARVSESALARHNYECLAYLIAAGRLDIRFVVMPGGHLFHPKVWIFQDDTDLVVVHGSSNLTAPGLLWNYEMVSLERAWRSRDAAEAASEYLRTFERLWDRRDDEAVVVSLPDAVHRDLLRDGRHRAAPTLEDFWSAWNGDAKRGLVPPRGRPFRVLAPVGTTLLIPHRLKYDSGPFAHQGQAVEAWEAAGRRGILAMATGSGKTIAALIAATRLAQSSPPLFAIVAAPYRPLIAQWEDEIQAFGVTPLPLSRLSPLERETRLNTAFRSLLSGVSLTEIAVITHDYLCDKGFRRILETVDAKIGTLLIADEVHNLGRPSFISDPPSEFRYRLGLSATPERQYDPEGTQALFDYFGPPVFTFSLAEAIRTCLVPYVYHIHIVDLSASEYADWQDLTERLRRFGFVSGDLEPEDSGPLSQQVVALLVRRRALLEMASGKLDVLYTLLQSCDRARIRHTLIYCSDKGTTQLDTVNHALGHDLGILYHQLTEEESSNRRRTREILNRFAEGELQIITCKRVLDEGVDIPQVTTAYLLASSTVQRQWIQRRGRILRQCPDIGKERAALHDFLVLPPQDGSAEARQIVRQELTRAREFARLASNAGAGGGPFGIIEDIMGRYQVGHVD